MEAVLPGADRLRHRDDDTPAQQPFPPERQTGRYPPADRAARALRARPPRQPAARRRRPDYHVRLAYGDRRAEKPGPAPAQVARHRERGAPPGRRRRRFPLAPELVRPSAIAERLTPDAVHQGLYLEADALASPAVEDLPAQGVVLVLDQITDPHNVGAIFRSAAAFAATAIVTTQRHSPDATGALAKAASGALEYVPLVSVQNLARGLAALKHSGFLVIGLELERRRRPRRPAATRAARAGVRRRGQGPAPTHQGYLRCRRPHRTAGQDHQPERVERGGARFVCRKPASGRRAIKSERRAPQPAARVPRFLLAI